MKKLKCRWYVASFDLSFYDFIESLKILKYTDESGFGFEFYSFTEESAEFKFIERKEKREVSADPFNNDVVNLIVFFTSFFISFTKISEEKILIKIKEPPASLKKFVETMNNITNFKFTISKIDIDIEDLYNYFTKKSIADRFTVLKAALKNLDIGPKTSASCEFISSENALQEIKEYFKYKKYFFEKIQISIRHSNSDEFIEASSSGLIVHTVNLHELVDQYVLSKSINNWN